jgi:hypothetical protein
MTLPELPKGLGAREYGKFRQTLHGQVGVGVVNLDEALNITLEVTESGDTEILPAPGETRYLTVKGFHFSNVDGSTITVCLKAGDGDQERFNVMLPASGGNFDKNLNGRNWRLPINKPLLVNLSAAGDVLVTIEYEGIGEPGEEAVYLTDTQAITEALIKEENKIISDTQSISEANVKDVTTEKTDVISINEDADNVVAAELAMTDSVAVAETVGNGITLALSDDISISEAEVEDHLTPA